MSAPEFQAFVRDHAVWFQGVAPESLDSLQSAERTLDLTLPGTMKWLLSQWGYSHAAGLDSLRESVGLTLECRLHRGLRHRFLVLNDWGDAGVVWTDRGEAGEHGESRIFWSGAHNFFRMVDGEPMDSDVDVFEDYPAWVRFRLDEARELPDSD